MTPEEKQLLQETANLVKENHKILKSMRRSARIASFMRALYWIIILGSVFGTYYLVQPYINALTEGYAGMKQNVSSVKGLTDKLPEILNNLGIK